MRTDSSAATQPLEYLALIESEPFTGLFRSRKRSLSKVEVVSMFASVTRLAQSVQRRLALRRLRRRLGQLDVVPVVLRRRVWQLHSAKVGGLGLDLAYNGPGGIWHLRLPCPDRASSLDVTAPGLTPVTVVFPDGCTVRCVGDSSDRFVPLPPHSDAVAALLPPMTHTTTDQLMALLDAASLSLDSAIDDGPRHDNGNDALDKLAKRGVKGRRGRGDSDKPGKLEPVGRDGSVGSEEPGRPGRSDRRGRHGRHRRKRARTHAA